MVKLTDPAGDLPWRFTMPATAPIPPNPADPEAVLGIADGHSTNYGRFLVATGPYMFEGTENLDFSVPAEDQEPVSGYVPGRSIVLVRNPSYDPATDGLRPAYPDRIETTIGGDTPTCTTRSRPARSTTSSMRAPACERPAGVQHQPRQAAVPAHVSAERGNYYISMNLGVPPFDDIHVRKALNWVFDKAGSIQLVRRCADRVRRRAHLPRRTHQQRAEGLRPVRDGGRSRRPGESQGRDGAVQVRHAMATASATTRSVDNVIALGVQQDPGPKTDGAVHAEPQGHRDRRSTRRLSTAP